ncbi:LOW QUALITY PROTEIN: ZNF433 isoform 5 [Pan troglodytes]|uniref:ZNF433 isoform 5 n=1 Tax=Pan troglodytes TaxID=9598 RepID=A0A2J8LVK8_PANTR|nr:LOW QUALITY PROTEIN: ZNF433 isoform 5 [Pan troglodytes]
MGDRNCRETHASMPGVSGSLEVMKSMFKVLTDLVPGFSGL